MQAPRVSCALCVLWSLGCEGALGLHDYSVQDTETSGSAPPPKLHAPACAASDGCNKGAPVVSTQAAARTDAGAGRGGAPAANGGNAAPQAQPEAGQVARDEDAGMPEPTATDIGLAVQYYPLNAQARDTVVAPALKIVNRSAAVPVPLRSLTLRYYFTNEHIDACPASCTVVGYYSGLQPTGMRIDPAREYHAASPARASAYIEITFPHTAEALGLGESAEVQQQFHTEPYRELDESNDYSFRMSPASYTDWDRVALFRDDVLVWGIPPRD